MEAYYIDKIFKKSAPAISTERASAGRQYERVAVAYCRDHHFKVLGKNLRFKLGEIDCLALDASRNQLILIEVRGRANDKRLPSRYLSASKQRRLKALAHLLVRVHGRSVRIVLLEVIGRIPHPSIQWMLEVKPHWVGISYRAFNLD